MNITVHFNIFNDLYFHNLKCRDNFFRALETETGDLEMGMGPARGRRHG